MLSLLLSTFRNNTITTVFESVLGNIARRLSTDRACEVGTMMSEDNIIITDIIEFCHSFTLR